MSRIIDLTLPLKPGMRGVILESAQVLEKDGWNATTICLYSHAGTHIDAPSHFGVGDETIDRIAVNRCVGPAWVVNLSGIAPCSLIEVEHLGEVEGKVRRGDSLLIKTGWSAYLGRPEYREALPRVSQALARWCAKTKIAMLGLEQPAVADVNNIEELTAVHKILFEAGVVIVEGLTNLGAITKEKVTFIALPLKVAGGDGAPARAIAIEDDD
jgi:kynurenine formamidase